MLGCAVPLHVGLTVLEINQCSGARFVHVMDRRGRMENSAGGRKAFARVFWMVIG
jgi:hypothetical protein